MAKELDLYDITILRNALRDLKKFRELSTDEFDLLLHFNALIDSVNILITGGTNGRTDR